ncbi:MAG TPA: hypothetical protein VGJ14_01155 [Sporichthyaceae bacterium]
MKRMVAIPAVAFALYSMAQEPAQSADAVSKGWDQLTQGTGSVTDGFFTFVNRL